MELPWSAEGGRGPLPSQPGQPDRPYTLFVHSVHHFLKIVLRDTENVPASRPSQSSISFVFFSLSSRLGLP